MYLGADITKISNIDRNLCWAMLADKYCNAMVKNVEETLEKKGPRLPSKCMTPLRSDYKSELDCTGDLKADGLPSYQIACVVCINKACRNNSLISRSFTLYGSQGCADDK